MRTTEGNDVGIRPTPAEAVVLLAVLHRAETDVGSIVDPAEQRALWNLLCKLERVGLPPAHPTVDAARMALCDTGDEDCR